MVGVLWKKWDGAWLAGAGLALVAVPAFAADTKEGEPAVVPVFEEAVAPLLVERCAACHDAETRKGEKTAEADQRVYVQGQEAEAVKGENTSKANIADYEAELAVKSAALIPCPGAARLTFPGFSTATSRCRGAATRSAIRSVGAPCA